ncbi:hypothetical protein CMMCAY01_07190 [Clavibacter michiganensis subsp. michiganensis]|nr:hypothetical protein CMMCAY01_07190 [Clavibacter michiganensis subsp. michiganensis]
MATNSVVPMANPPIARASRATRTRAGDRVARPVEGGFTRRAYRRSGSGPGLGTGTGTGAGVRRQASAPRASMACSRRSSLPVSSPS